MYKLHIMKGHRHSLLMAYLEVFYGWEETLFVQYFQYLRCEVINQTLVFCYEEWFEGFELLRKKITKWVFIL